VAGWRSAAGFLAGPVRCFRSVGNRIADTGFGSDKHFQKCISWAEREQRIQCAVRLEGIVLWASAARDQFVLQDDSGAAFVLADLHGQTLHRVNGSLWLATAWQMGTDLFSQSPVVDNDGLHIMTEKSGKVFLRAGKHPIRVSWFNRDTPSGLEVYYQGRTCHVRGARRGVVSILKTVPDSGSVHWSNGLNYQCYEGNGSRCPLLSRVR